MTFQSFTHNYTDHSNDQGFQFEFHCDKCRNGYRSSFHVNKVGMISSLIKSANSIFGGRLGNVGWGADQVKDIFRGPAWDAAFKQAIEEMRPQFRQCTRCGNWVCPEVCWNEQHSLCLNCAPNLQIETAHLQAEIAVEQLEQHIRETDQTHGQEVKSAQFAACPHCNAHITADAKFCTSCGQLLHGAANKFCGQCGKPITVTDKFCANCGTGVTV